METTKRINTIKVLILEALLRGEVIDATYGLFNLKSGYSTLKTTTRISELIAEGFPIIKEWKKSSNGVRLMTYRIENTELAIEVAQGKYKALYGVA